MPNLLKLIEGDYCCLYGYLALCNARGERTLDMAKNIGVPARTLRYHYTVMNRGRMRRGHHKVPSTHQCKRKEAGECLQPHITAIILLRD